MAQATTATPARATTPAPETQPTRDPMPLLGIDHIELYVGNAVHAAHYLTRALGFRESAFAGLETGVRDRASRVLEQGRIRLVVTAALGADSDIARHVREHGDGA